MRRFLLSLFAALLFSGAAFAQTEAPARWVDPTGKWSLNLIGNFWIQRFDVPPAFAHYVLVAAPQDAVNADNFRTCTVAETFIPLPPGGAEQLRVQATGIDQERAARMYAPETIESVTHATIDGVAYVDIRARQETGFRRHRMFSLQVGNRGVVVDLSCSWRAGVTALERADIDGIFDSFRLQQTGATTWTHPTAGYTLTTTGFVDRGPEDGDDSVALFTRWDAPAGPPQHMCRIIHRVFSTDAQLSVADANERLHSDLVQTTTQQHFRNLTETSTSGVRVFNYELETDGGAQAHLRAFLLPSRGGINYHQISCGGSTPFSADDWALLDGFLNSLAMPQPRMRR